MWLPLQLKKRKEVIMKLSRGFVVFIVILFVVLVMVEVKIPEKFNWKNVTYLHNDPNPFGALLVDSILKSSVKAGYEVRYGDLFDAYYDSVDTESSILLVDPSLFEYAEELKGILKRGQNVIIISDYFTDTLASTFGIDFDNSYRYYIDYDNLDYNDSSLLKWRKDGLYDREDFCFKSFDVFDMCGITFVNDKDTIWTKLLYEERQSKDVTVAASRKYGKGKLVLVAWTQVFTNYNVLEKGGAQLLLRIISQVGNKKPIIRYDDNPVEDPLVEGYQSQSPLRVFLDHHSLRWAVYLTLLTIVMSLIFTARRKQRVIPVVEPPKNQTLAMVKHIGLMHYRHHDNASLVRDRFAQFKQEIMRKLLVDIDDDIDVSENLSLIRNQAGVDGDQFVDAVSRLREIAVDYDLVLTDTETKYLLDLMNNIINNV